MYAVIRTGGKQYTVRPGDVLQVAKLSNDLGSQFDITEVLLVGGDTPQIGAPLVSGATVAVTVTKHGKTRKLDVFKKKRRHSYRKWNTHRQDFTEIFVRGISFGGQTAKAEGEPRIVDVAASRVQRIEDKKTEARARRAKGGDQSSEMTTEAAEGTTTTTKKKVAKKATAKKATAKKATSSKAGVKKAAKKTSKKA